MNFTEFWSAYPAKSQHKGSKTDANRLWAKLNMYERHAAELSLPIYENHLHENGWKNPMMVRTYIGRGRHWESFQPSESVNADIGRINARREETRRRNAENDAYAKQQWREKFIRQYGREP